ncbi:MAG: thiamine phosphate synthase [Burkholderiaceae bacterium]
MKLESARLAGVYLLTPDSDARDFDATLAVVLQALEAGVRAIQYRDKLCDTAERLDRASRVAELTRAAGAILIVNDSIEAAICSGADGVHLGRDDGDIANARERLPHRLIGVSCYNQFDRARAAIAAGADAIAFGSIFESATKPAAVRAPLALLSDARAAWPQQRIIAIGGINADNIAAVGVAGAHAAAVLGAVFGTDRPAQAVRELIRRFDQGKIQHDEQRTTV